MNRLVCKEIVQCCIMNHRVTTGYKNITSHIHSNTRVITREGLNATIFQSSMCIKAR